MYYLQILRELIMQLLIGGLIYLFWANYRRSQNNMALLIAGFFSVVFIYHLIFSLILEDIMNVNLSNLYNSHHVILMATLLVLNCVLLRESLKGKSFASPKKVSEKKHAA